MGALQGIRVLDLSRVLAVVVWANLGRPWRRSD